MMAPPANPKATGDFQEVETQWRLYLAEDSILFQYRHISWWYWLAMALLLAFGLSVWNPAFVWAIALGVVQCIHFVLREGRLQAFPVQVRLAYVALLSLGQWEPFFFMYWIQLAGTSAMVLFGYCPLARFLSLMPWNRTQPFTFSLLALTCLSRPVRGNILQGLPAKS